MSISEIQAPQGVNVYTLTTDEDAEAKRIEQLSIERIQANIPADGSPFMTVLSSINNHDGCTGAFSFLPVPMKAKFTCACCGERVGVLREDLPRFWHTVPGEIKGITYKEPDLFCALCREPNAPGTHALSAIWHPLDDNGLVLSWMFWDHHFRDYVIQEYNQIDQNHRIYRRRVAEEMPDQLRDWSREGGQVEPTEDLANGAGATFLSAVLAYASLDLRIKRLEPLYDWAESDNCMLDRPTDVGCEPGWETDGIKCHGYVPFMGYFFAEFLRNECPLYQKDWPRFVNAFNEYQAARKEQRKGEFHP